jgi:hypothetical protein
MPAMWVKVKGVNLGEIIDNVYRKYPSFDKFDAKQYKRFFPKLNEDEILKNSEVILLFMEKIMAFETASAFSQLENAEYSLADYVKPKSKNGRIIMSAQGFFNGVCTVSIVISHLRLDMSGLYDAYCYALDDSAQYGTPTTGGGDDYMDAIRHGIWAVYMGKYGTWRYNKATACNILDALITSHECAASGMPKKMDFHNNKVSLQYYSNNVVQSGPWWNPSTSIGQSRLQIINDMKSLPAHQVSTEAEISQKNNYTLVVLR